MSPGHAEWADRHAAAFGLISREEANMILSWADFFERGGVAVVELDEATVSMMHNPPKFRSEHLPAIQACIRAQRARREAAPPAADEGLICPLCRGSGLASVPSRKAAAQGAWGTEAVTCSCNLGRWLANGKLSHWTSLSAYERERPRWRAEVAERAERFKREAALSHQAGALDKQFGAIFARLRQGRVGK